MPARASSFLRIEILLLLLAFPLLTAGCGPRQIWGIPVEALKADLAAARYGSLASVDFSAQDPAECLDLSPDAPFYLSFVFSSLEKTEQSQRMLELAWSRCPSPWKEEAGIRLAQGYISQKSYDRAIDVARRLVSSPVSADVEQRARRALVEALYWNKDDAAALREAVRLDHPDAEVLLFRAVSSLRLGLPSAHDLVMQLFLSEKVSSLHGRVYSFIADEPTYLGLFTAQEQDLLAGKNALGQGAWDKGIPLLEGVLSSIDPGVIADGVLIVDLGNSFLYAGKLSEGAQFMENLAPRLTGQARTDALEQAGRLYRRAKDYNRAIPVLRTAAAEAVSAAQRDRASWFITDILFSLDPADIASRVGAESRLWNDPSYFSNLLQSRIAELVAARHWKILMGLWRALEATAPDEVRAQLSYLLARAWQEGAIARLPGSPPVTARELFLDAERRDASGYYGILAASMLGDLPDRAVPADTDVQAGGRIILDPTAIGFIAFGLTDQAYGRLWAGRDSLSDAQLLEAARRFADAGDYRSSMYFVGAVARRRRLSLPELRMYYPRAYSSLIEPLASGAGIPLHVLYGLVREESYFDANVVSSAGAVGLSQLMPSTAAAVAKSLHLQDPDLIDPFTNLTIGVRHYKDLFGSAGSTTGALLAYNAGLTRLRQWERAAKGLAADLFIESVPIAETRGYVRKILISSVMYAFLYRDTDPREAALSFFGISTQALEPEPGSKRPTRMSPR
ncbi:MAG: lytic transglycosylase domain-containing protein [Spirochaetia bacterium]